MVKTLAPPANEKRYWRDKLLVVNYVKFHLAILIIYAERAKIMFSHLEGKIRDPENEWD